MRIHLNVQNNESYIPFNHQSLLTGTIHKWIGKNNEHGKISLYSFSQLKGGKATQMGLKFSDYTSFFISAYDPMFLKKIIRGIQEDPKMFNGLIVKDVIIQEDPDFTNREIFYSASPIFIKRKLDDKIEHILYNDPRANSCLKESLLTKMKIAGITDDSLQLKFIENDPSACTKKINYKEIENRASWCPIIIDANPLTKLFAWNVGLGNSTGIGFGAIK